MLELDPERHRTKCSAIILANIAKRSGDRAEAIRYYKIAAPLEEEAAETLAALERPDFMINLSSAVWCWFFAGDSERALSLGQVGLDLSVALKANPCCVIELQRTMRRVRRGKWPRPQRS